MSTLAVANQAGSAGKTTTVINVGALLAEAGKRVRIVDLDGQANATYALGRSGPARTTGDVLLRRSTLDAATVTTDVDRLTLVPTTNSLDDDAVELGRTLAGEQRLRLALEAAEPVDVTIIDCPGALSVLTVAALVAADAVITCTQPTVKELEGIPKLEGTIADVAAAYNPTLRLGAIVPCIVPPAGAGALYAEAMQLLHETHNGTVTPSVRRSVRIPEAYSQQQPLSVHAPHEPVTEDYRQVVAALSERGLV